MGWINELDKDIMGEDARIRLLKFLRLVFQPLFLYYRYSFYFSPNHSFFDCEDNYITELEKVKEKKFFLVL